MRIRGLYNIIVLRKFHGGKTVGFRYYRILIRPKNYNFNYFLDLTKYYYVEEYYRLYYIIIALSINNMVLKIMAVHRVKQKNVNCKLLLSQERYIIKKQTFGPCVNVNTRK